MASFNMNLTTWRAPHWWTVAGVAVGGAIVDYLIAIPASEIFQDLTTRQGLQALGKGAAVAGIASLVGVAKLILSPGAQKASNALKAQEVTK